MLSFSEFEERSQPVFLFGKNRSGTTLLYNIVRHHKSILKLPFSTHFFQDIYPYLGKLDEKILLKIITSSSDLSSIKCNLDLESKSGQLEYLSLNKPLREKIVKKDARGIYISIAYFTYYFQKKPSLLWVGKSDQNFSYWKILKEWFPDAKFIVSIRDPRGIIASEVSRSKNRSLYYIIQLSLAIIRNYSSILKTKREYPDDIIIIPYEEIVLDTRKILKHLSEFLKIDDFARDEVEKIINDAGFTYPSEAGGQERSSAIDKLSLEKWKNILSKNEIKVIENVINSNLSDFGYKFNGSSLNIKESLYIDLIKSYKSLRNLVKTEKVKL